jgi:hypothetical protein
MALDELNQFHGSEHNTRHGMNRNLIYTEGVAYVAEEGHAFWLLDDIAIANMFEPSLKAEGFQLWTLTKGTNDSAILSATDGNKKTLYSKSIEFTDFPLDEIKFYLVDAPDFGEKAVMLMLPSEY